MLLPELMCRQHNIRQGGKVKTNTIDKGKKSTLGSLLISGAMSAEKQVIKRKTRTKKGVWQKSLIEHCGNKCAAVHQQIKR